MTLVEWLLTKRDRKLQEGLKNSLPVFLGGLGGSGGHELKNFF